MSSAKRTSFFSLIEMIKKGFNEYKVIGDTVEIYIKNNIVVIDLEDLPIVNCHRWYITSDPIYPYADVWDMKTRSRGKRIRMHSLIIGKKQGLVIDHINGNKLDNRKSNLRHVNYSMNSRNSRKLGYSISLSKKDRSLKRVIVQMTNVDGKGKNIMKRFWTPKEALDYRRCMELKLFGLDINRT